MILSFRNEEPARHRKGQKECGKGISGGIFGPWCRAKAARILARLDIAREPKDMALPGWRLSPLKGQTDIGAEGPLFQQRWAVCRAVILGVTRRKKVHSEIGRYLFHDLRFDVARFLLKTVCTNPQGIV